MIKINRCLHVLLFSWTLLSPEHMMPFWRQRQRQNKQADKYYDDPHSTILKKKNEIREVNKKLKIRKLTICTMVCKWQSVLKWDDQQ